MWVGTYTLDLYCDRQGAFTRLSGDGLFDAAGHVHGEFPHQYHGESGPEQRSRARRAGWVLGRDGSAICPKCSGKARAGKSVGGKEPAA